MELDLSLWLLTALIGFGAGLIDSIVGGGGLVATPAMLNLHPGLHILQIIGTNRTSSIFGTGVAAWNYLRRIRIERRVLIPACVSALLASALGVQLAKRMDGDTLKWIVLAICLALALYTAFRRDLGLREERRFHPKHEALAAASIGAATGFYNGLVGPGTGTIMVFAFVSFLGLDFLKSSAVSKATNVAADLSSWTVLMFAGFIVWALAIPLILGNMIGSHLGSHLAIRRGQGFVRAVFLCIVLALIARQAWQLASA